MLFFQQLLFINILYINPLMRLSDDALLLCNAFLESVQTRFVEKKKRARTICVAI